MLEYVQNLDLDLDLNQYLPATIAWATNILLAIVILLFGLWFAKNVNNFIVNIGKKYTHLDVTLFRFLGSVARYGILAFVFIAVLNLFGVQTASIVALLGAAGRFGKVTVVDMFTTILQTFDHQQIIIPNSQIWGEQIINHSHYSVRGVDMRFGVAYDENTDKARAVLMLFYLRILMLLKILRHFLKWKH